MKATDELRSEIARRMREPFFGFRPLPASMGQREFVAALAPRPDPALLPSGVHILKGGNRSGKSTVGGWVAARHAIVTLKRWQKATGKRAPFWVISPNYEMSGEIVWKDKLKRFIHPRNIDAISYRDANKDWPAYLRTVDGVEILFKSADQGRGAFQGTAIGGAWIDEQIPQDVLEETMTRCIDYGAPLFQTLTPLEPDEFLEERFDDPPDGWHWYETTIDENRISIGGTLRDEEVDRFLASIPPLLRETRRRGVFASYEGVVFPEFSRHVHVRDFDVGMIPGEWYRFRGVDFGMNSPTCVLWAALDPEDVLWVYDEHHEAHATAEHHAREVIRRTGGARIEATWVDPAGDVLQSEDGIDVRRSARAVFQNHGIDITPATKSWIASYEEIGRRLKMRPHAEFGEFPGIVIHKSRCPNLIRQLPKYRFASPPKAKQRDTKDPREKVVKRDDHAVDALRYLSTGVATYIGDRAGDAKDRLVGVKREVAIGRGRGVFE